MLNRHNFYGINIFLVVAVALGTVILPDRSLAQISAPLEAEAIAPRYLLGPGDQIQITVFGYEEYTEQHLIFSDGTIVLPLIGAVIVGNRTPAQLAQELTIRLKEYLVDPVVSISLISSRPITINVAGEVQRPGPVVLRSLNSFASAYNTAPLTPTNAGVSSLQFPTVAAALLEAGGVTREADIRRVALKRYSPNGDSPPITINLWDAIVSEAPPRNLILQDGDSLFIPKLMPGESIDHRLVARSSFAPKTVRVRVVGEVKNPGEMAVPPNSSLSSAVAIAGGPTDKAKLSNVNFIRLNEDGAIEEQVVDLRQLNDTYQVQEGDVIVVPKSNTSTLLDFAGNLVNPFNFLLNLFR